MQVQTLAFVRVYARWCHAYVCVWGVSEVIVCGVRGSWDFSGMPCASAVMVAVVVVRGWAGG